MIDVLETMKKLPERCFTVLPTNPRLVIGIHRGVRGYTLLCERETREEAAAMAQRLNGGCVDAAQVAAMEIGSIFGWHVPGADPDTHRAEIETSSD